MSPQAECFDPAPISMGGGGVHYSGERVEVGGSLGGHHGAAKMSGGSRCTRAAGARERALVNTVGTFAAVVRGAIRALVAGDVIGCAL